MDADTAFVKLKAIQEAVRRFTRETNRIDLGFNGAKVMADVEKTARAIENRLDDLHANVKVRVDDSQLGDFERKAAAAINQASARLPALEVGAHTDRAERQIRNLREQLIELGDKQIGVDIDAEHALMEVRRIEEALDEISRSETADINVRLNASVAAADLRRIREDVEKLDGQTAVIDVDVRGGGRAANEIDRVGDSAGRAGRLGQDGANSFRAFNIRILGVAAIGPAVVPVLGALAGGLLALGPLAAAAAAGMGVLTLGLWGVGDALKALGDEQESAGQNALDHAQAVRTAGNSVRDAERGVADARTAAARSSVDAQERVESALRGVVTAERGLRDAQRDAASAQRDLAQARRDYAEQQEDLALRVRGGALAEREAILSIAEAEAELREVMGDPEATQLDRERAILNLERQRLGLDEVRESNGDLAIAQAEAARTGVEGSEQVVSAQERLRQANERVADAQQGIADAQADVARARAEQSQAALDSQRRIEDAQIQLTDAQARYNEALNETSTEAQKVAEEMAKLGPAGQAFVLYLHGLRDEVMNLRGIAQEGFLPGFQYWIDSMIGYHGPLLIETVRNISRALGDMFVQFGDSFRGPAFTQFFEMLRDAGPRYIDYLAQTLVNLGEGFASLIVASQPLADLFGEWLVDRTQQFADAMLRLGTNEAFQGFMDYVAYILPKVEAFFWALIKAVTNLLVALAPFGEAVMNAFTGILDFIAEMDPSILGPIVAALFSLVFVLQLVFAAASSVFSLTAAIHLTMGTLGAGAAGAGASVGILARNIALIVGAVALVIPALINLYQESEAFRDLIGLIGDILGDVLGFLVDLVQGGLELMSGVLVDILPLLTSIVAGFLAFKTVGFVVALFTAIWNAVRLLPTALGLLRLSLQTTATSAAASFATMGTAANAAFGVIGLLVGAVVFAMTAGGDSAEEAAAQFDKLFEKMREGGAAAIQARAEIEAMRLELERAIEAGRRADDEEGPGYVGGIGGASTQELRANQDLEEFNEQLAEAERRARAFWDSLSPIEQAEQKVAEWTNTLSYRLEHYGENSELARIATERLEHWQAILESRQYALDAATRGTTGAIADQSSAMVTAYDAAFAYEQAILRLTDAHARLVEARKTADPNDDIQAMMAWEQAIDGVADAATRVAEARYASLGEDEREVRVNAARLLELERQKQIYGELPPRLEELRAGLASIIDPTTLATVSMDNLGLSVLSIPDEKSIQVAALTGEAEQALRNLGFTVTEMPDGTVILTAPGIPELEEALNNVARDRQVQIVTSWREAVEDWGEYYNSIPTRAYGGPIFGPGTGTSDSILARVSNGEYVVRAAAVRALGLDFLNEINQAGGPAYRHGGPVRKQGFPAFEEGGYVANFGGSIAINDLNGIGQIFFAGLNQAVEIVRQGAALMTGMFATMAASMANSARVGAESLPAAWTPAFATLAFQANQAAAAVNAAFASLNAVPPLIKMITASVLGDWTTMTTGVTQQTRMLSTQVVTIFALMGLQLTLSWLATTLGLRQQTGDLVKYNIQQFGTMQDQLVASMEMTRALLTLSWLGFTLAHRRTTSDLVNWTLDEFNRMATGIILSTTFMQLAISRLWAQVPGIIQRPVNFIIGAVLNKGLFNAFNSIVRTMGLNPSWNIPPAPSTPAYLAAGGRVPGWSPNDKADNIPAMLTAGEFVLPVDAVKYYGPDLLELMRRRMLPPERLAHYATGGQIFDATRRIFPRAKLNSSYRPGDRGYHGKNMAADMGEAGFPGGMGRAYIAAMKRWWVDTYGRSAEEIIYNGLGNDRPNINNGRPFPYSAATQRDHYDHLHVAESGPLVASDGTPFLDFGGVIEPMYPAWFHEFGNAAGVKKRLDESTLAVMQLALLFGRNTLTGMLGDMPPVAVNRMWTMMGPEVERKFAEAIAGAMTGVLGSIGPSLASGPIVDIVRSVADRYGWGSGNEWNALSRLIQKESSWNPNAQNPTSTAFGLFQFLNSTWAGTGIAKTKDPGQQTEAGLRYIRSRYGTPSKALAFHNANNWYSEGGEVTPELNDLGSVLNPGIHVLANKTRQPEVVLPITPGQLENLVDVTERGGNGSLFRDLNLPIMPTATPNDVASEVVHRITVAQRGGKYS